MLSKCGSWLPSAISRSIRRQPDGAVHLLLCIADHYEPQLGKPDATTAQNRVESWVKNYPLLCARFRDSDGLPPRHTFFFPIDEYIPAHVEGIAGLCRQGLGEVEIHHHHDNDTPDALRGRLLHYVNIFRNQHGLLASTKIATQNNEQERLAAIITDDPSRIENRKSKIENPRYAFVHGNWALNNSRPDGRWCGICNEIKILRDTGCYADFTLPSAPSPTQTRKINSIYYARGHDDRPKGHDTGIDVGVPARNGTLHDSLMLIQGPLLLNWRRRKYGIIPRLENSCLQGNQPPTMERLDLWLKARVQVPQRPDWYFVKLHTHGAPEKNQKVLLGEPMERFHAGLAERAAKDPRFRYHYVTAREMYNLARAAEAGFQGTVAEARDFELVWKP